MPHQQLITHLR